MTVVICTTAFVKICNNKNNHENYLNIQVQWTHAQGSEGRGMKLRGDLIGGGGGWQLLVIYDTVYTFLYALLFSCFVEELVL